MRRPNGKRKGTVVIACATGLLLSFVCPPEFLVVVLTVALIVLGITCFFC